MSLYKKINKRVTALAAVFVVLVYSITVFPATRADAVFTNDVPIHCDAVYMINLDTEIVVFEKNPDKIKFPASMTKMITCILAIEYYSDLVQEKYTIPEKVPGDKKILSEGAWSTTGLVAGERVSVKDLLYCALLPSDNVAALALAYKVSDDKGDGTLSWFIQRMNAKAREIGCVNTHFANPHGLYDDNHQSTARDMAKIAEYCMRDPVFSEIVGCKTAYYRAPTNKHPYSELSDVSTPGSEIAFMRMETTNKLMLSSTAGHKDDGKDEELKYYYQYVKGVKTGFIKDAGHCYASYATKDGYRYVLVMMDDRSAISDGLKIEVDWENPEWKKDKTQYNLGNSKNKTLSELVNNRESTKNYAFIDAKRLYEWAFSDLAMKEVFKAGDTVKEVPIANAWDKDTLALVPATSFKTLLPVNVTAKSIDVETHIPENLSAPVKQGQVIGTATLRYGGDVFGTIELVAGETVERSDGLYILSIVGKFFGSKWFYVLLGCMVLGAGVFVVLSFVRDQRLSTLSRSRRSVRTTGVWREGSYRDPRYTGPVTTASESTQNGTAVRSSGFDIFGKAREKERERQMIENRVMREGFGDEVFSREFSLGGALRKVFKALSLSLVFIGKAVSSRFPARNARYASRSAYRPKQNRGRMYGDDYE